MKKSIETKIEEALREEPAFKVNQSFKHSVFKAIRRKERNAQRRIYVWMVLGLLFMSVSAVIIFRLYFPDLAQNLRVSQINSIVPLAVVIGVIVVVVQYLDKRLVKDQMLTH